MNNNLSRATCHVCGLKIEFTNGNPQELIAHTLHCHDQGKIIQYNPSSCCINTKKNKNKGAPCLKPTSILKSATVCTLSKKTQVCKAPRKDECNKKESNSLCTKEKNSECQYSRPPEIPCHAEGKTNKNTTECKITSIPICTEKCSGLDAMEQNVPEKHLSRSDQPDGRYLKPRRACITGNIKREIRSCRPPTSNNRKCETKQVQCENPPNHRSNAVCYPARRCVSAKSPPKKCSRSNFQKRRGTTEMYKTTFETWTAGTGYIDCPKCKKKVIPLVRKQKNKVAFTAVGASFLLTCWPFCFLLPMMHNSSVDLYCPCCKCKLGIYNSSTGRTTTVPCSKKKSK